MLSLVISHSNHRRLVHRTGQFLRTTFWSFNPHQILVSIVRVPLFIVTSRLWRSLWLHFKTIFRQWHNARPIDWAPNHRFLSEAFLCNKQRKKSNLLNNSFFCSFSHYTAYSCIRKLGHLMHSSSLVLVRFRIRFTCEANAHTLCCVLCELRPGDTLSHEPCTRWYARWLTVAILDLPNASLALLHKWKYNIFLLLRLNKENLLLRK